MNIPAAFIRRPIATGMLMAAILLLGLISYELLPVAALPNIDTPTVLVTAQFPGAGSFRRNTHAPAFYRHHSNP